MPHKGFAEPGDSCDDACRRTALTHKALHTRQGQEVREGARQALLARLQGLGCAFLDIDLSGFFCVCHIWLGESMQPVCDFVQHSGTVQQKQRCWWPHQLFADLCQAAVWLRVDLGICWTGQNAVDSWRLEFTPRMNDTHLLLWGYAKLQHKSSVCRTRIAD